MKRIACIGECLVELIQVDRPDQYTRSYAGDTFNTAVYCKRFFKEDVELFYFTAVGYDQLSEGMLSYFQQEGIRTDFVQRIEGKAPGLYLIENDQQGERFFQYYRSDSAASSMFKNSSVDWLAEKLSAFDLIYLTGITLAILDPPQRELLYAALQLIPQQKIIAFDPNFRPALWQNIQQARDEFNTIGKMATTILTGKEDELNMWQGRTGRQTVAHWKSLGCSEVILKNGANSCLVAYGNEIIKVPIFKKQVPIDTTGAGDSFDAGYLCSRLLDIAPVKSVESGHRLAQEVIMYQGGIIPQK